MRKVRMRMGKMECPVCLGLVPSSARACRHCGHAFSQQQIDEQAAYERRVWKSAPYTLGGLAVVVLTISTCSYHELHRPLSQAETVAARKSEAETRTQEASFRAEGTASSAVKGRMKNPASFELVETSANNGRMDDGRLCWIVAVTYRATNSFGGVIQGHALVWVDKTGMSTLRVSIID